MIFDLIIYTQHCQQKLACFICMQSCLLPFMEWTTSPSYNIYEISNEEKRVCFCMSGSIGSIAKQGKLTRHPVYNIFSLKTFISCFLESEKAVRK